MRNIIFAGGPLHLRKHEESHAEFGHMGYMLGNKYWAYKKECKHYGWEVWPSNYSTEEEVKEAKLAVEEMKENS